jgi:hypothetical protein
MNKDYKKPPLGLMPKHIFEHNNNIKRFEDVCDAISRYYNESRKIPIEWISEYNELIDKLNKR